VILIQEQPSWIVPQQVETFADAILKKMILEIAGRQPIRVGKR
jgi:hypothetical protein